MLGLNLGAVEAYVIRDLCCPKLRLQFVDKKIGLPVFLATPTTGRVVRIVVIKPDGPIFDSYERSKSL